MPMKLGRSRSTVEAPVLTTVFTVLAVIAMAVWVAWAAMSGAPPSGSKGGGNGKGGNGIELHQNLETCRRSGVGACHVETDSDGTQSVYGGTPTETTRTGEIDGNAGSRGIRRTCLTVGDGVCKSADSAAAALARAAAPTCKAREKDATAIAWISGNEIEVECLGEFTEWAPGQAATAGA